jgi:Tfp pilus assembly protein PilV
VILVVILVCLSVTAVILSSFVLTTAAGRETLQSEQWQLQAQWLAESAFERTSAQLLADPDYVGGSWAVSAKPTSSTKPTGTAENGMATIRVERVADQPLTRVVHVQADYPDDPIHRCRYAKQWTVALPKPPEPETEKPDETQKPESSPKPAESSKPDTALTTDVVSKPEDSKADQVAKPENTIKPAEATTTEKPSDPTTPSQE